MKALLEIHALQNFVPSNLNRDDTGSPKDAEFGGFRRGRISSQAQKRAMRLYVSRDELLNADELGVRTKRVVSELVKRLKDAERDEATATRVVEAALSGLSLGIEEGKSQYLLFLGEMEIQQVAAVIAEHWETLLATIDDAEKPKRSKKDAKKTIPREVTEALEKSLDGGKAVDLALFGRMLADLPDRNRDAAAQVAHAISTNETSREFDFYTAVDDLKPSDTSGADMLGTIEFNSACYYRYIAIDLVKLLDNLQEDLELFERGLDAFLRAAYFAAPSGMQNSFAAHNPPAMFAVSVRKDVAPRNLANAFENPVQPRDGRSLTERSLSRLDRQWQTYDEALGTGSLNEIAVLSLIDGLDHLKASKRSTLVDVVEASVKAARKAVAS